MNIVTLIGRLGTDPDLRHTQSGNAVVNFRMVTSERWYDKQKQESVEEATWHSIVVWGKQAETCANHIGKGSQVGITGRLQEREFEDKDGNKRKVIEIVANKVEFVGSKKDREQGGQQQSQGGGGPSDDDIPFAAVWWPE